MSKLSNFLKKKDIEISLNRYLISAMSYMAQGLFCSLLIGTIINTIGTHFHLSFLIKEICKIGSVSYSIGELAMAMSGPAMAVGIGYALKSPPLVLFSLVTVGFSANTLGGAGGPLAVFIITIISCELGKLVSKETKIDILVTPIITISTGVFLSYLIAPVLGSLAFKLGNFIMWATELRPFIMGIIVSVTVGIALTLPISSAAICASLGLTGLAGGSAVAGCCAQMIGFAVISFRENKISGLISQGLGTSMLQMPNIIKNPKIWISPTLASAITGPLSSCIFKLKMNGPAISSGMGTCGLVGPLGIYTGWINDISNNLKDKITLNDWIALFSICFILPGLLSYIFYLILKKMSWIKDEDFRLNSEL